MAPGPLPCAVNAVCPVLVWSHTFAGLFLQGSVSDDAQLYQAFCFCSDSFLKLIVFEDDLLLNGKWYHNKSRGPSDWAFVRYKMDLTPWTLSPPQVFLTSTLLLPLTHGLVTSDGHRGVNPSLLQTPATVKSGVIHKPVWRGKCTALPQRQCVCTQWCKDLFWCFLSCRDSELI